MTAGQTLAPLDSSSTSGSGSTSSSSSSSSDSGSATISANDFLELLVTEMQNQDPTDETDPNEYIDQLVDVNSLEQLIDINQTLSGAFGTSSSSSTSDAATAQTPGGSTSASSALTPSGSPSSTALGRVSAPAPTSIPGAIGAFSSAGAPSSAVAQTPRRVPGNLSPPAAIPAAERVAHALNGSAGGRPRAKPLGGKLAGFEQTSLNNRP